MAVKYKYIYGVWLLTKNSIGMQPVKANNKVQARQRFRKRFKKQTILDIKKLETKTITEPI